MNRTGRRRSRRGTSRARQCTDTFAPLMLKTTPFHARTAPLVRAQTWRRWAGFQVASAYEPHPDREYAAIRNAAGTPTLSVGDMFNSSTDGAVLTITSINATTGQVGFSVQHQYLDDGLAPGNNTPSV